jgi:hypothetical protein
MELAELIALLNEHHQRATYGAIAAVVGGIAQGIGPRLGARNHLHSWAVNKRTGLPTVYAAAERHPQLLENAHWIANGEELQAWLHQQGG